MPDLQVTVIESEDRTDVRLHDSGSGIPAVNQSWIFEPVFATREKSADGVRGVGLSVCCGLADRQGLHRASGRHGLLLQQFRRRGDSG